MAPGSPTAKPLFVTIVSNHEKTIRELETYLRGAGVAANGTRAVERVLEMTPPSSTAVVLFPDEYLHTGVRSALDALHRERPEILVVIVTNEPRRFERRSRTTAQDALPLVIPKPAWAWTILDAVRARIDSQPPPAASSP